VSFGNFHTLRCYFPTPEKAQSWALYIRSEHSKGPVHNLIMDGGGQTELF
jgi:hypothetical protein